MIIVITRKHQLKKPLPEDISASVCFKYEIVLANYFKEGCISLSCNSGRKKLDAAEKNLRELGYI